MSTHLDSVAIYGKVRKSLEDVHALLAPSDAPEDEAQYNDLAYADFLDLAYAAGSPDADFLLYLGAGVSRPVGAPNWEELLQQLFEAMVLPGGRLERLRTWCRAIDDPATARAILEEIGGDPGTVEKRPPVRPLLRVFDKLHLAWLIGEVDRANRDAKIAGILHRVKPQESDLIDAVLRLPASEVITTNYDLFFEKKLEERALRLKVSPVDRDHDGLMPQEPHLSSFLACHPVYDRHSLSQSFGGSAQVRLFYLHGAIAPTNHFHPVRAHLVLDRFDYARLLSERDGLFDYVTYLMRHMPAIYIGARLDDPTFNLIETRLFSLDSVRAAGSPGELPRIETVRPAAYAFVPVATTSERAAWRQRRVHLICYGRHENLPFLLNALADCRKFLCWAKPSRLPDKSRKDLTPDRHFIEALRVYTDGSYADAIVHARAALATTLLWDRPLSKDHLETLISIRTRLGLSHYHRRYTDEAGWERINVNIQEAETHLLEARKKADSRQLHSHELSLKALTARCAYTKGNWAAARDGFEQVVNNVGGLEALARSGPLNEADCRILEVGAYANCQLARIGYQTRAANDEATKVSADLQKMARVLGDVSFHANVPREQRVYFEKSFSAISVVARWFAARYAIGQFLDIVPVSEECIRPRLDRIKTGIDELEDSARPMPNSWEALGKRYLGRGYCLHWYLEHKLNGAASHGHLESAYSAVGYAVQLVRPDVQKRDYVLNHLEMGRLITLCQYGRVLMGGQRVSQDLMLVAGYHLGLAMRVMRGLYDRDQHFVRSVLIRIASYVYLLCRVDGQAPPRLVEDLPMRDPVNAVRDCFKKMGDSEDLLTKRVERFKQAHSLLKSELESAGTRQRR